MMKKIFDHWKNRLQGWTLSRHSLHHEPKVRWMVLVLLISLFLVFACFNGLKIYRSFSETKNLVVLEDPLARQGLIRLGYAAGTMRVRQSENAKRLVGETLAPVRKGEELHDRDLILLDRALYEYRLISGSRSWVTIFNRIVAYNRTFSFGTSPRSDIVLDRPGVAPTAVQVSLAKSPLIVLSVLQGGVEVASGKKVLRPAPGETLTLFKDAEISIEGDRFRVSVVRQRQMHGRSDSDWKITEAVRVDQLRQIAAAPKAATPRAELACRGYLVPVTELLKPGRGFPALGSDELLRHCSFSEAAGGLSLVNRARLPMYAADAGRGMVTVPPGGVLPVGADLELFFQDRAGGARLTRTDSGYLVRFDDAGSDSRLSLPVAGDFTVAGLGKLFRNVQGSLIPDSYTMDVLSKVENLFGVKDDRGFLVTIKERTRKKTQDLSKNETFADNFISHYNRLRAPAGLLIDGNISYTDRFGTSIRYPLNSRSGWLSSSDQQQWAAADGEWPYHPMINLYADTRFSGLGWLWHSEPWRPDKRPEPASRIFRLPFSLDAASIREGDLKIAALGELTVKMNGVTLPMSDPEERFGPIVLRKFKLNQWVRTGPNLLEVAVSQQTGPLDLLPFVFWNDYGVFSNQSEAQSLVLELRRAGVEGVDVFPDERAYRVSAPREDVSKTLKLLAGSPPLKLKVINQRVRNKETRGNIVDSDAQSIPRFIVIRGNETLQTGTEIFLDNLKPSLRKGGRAPNGVKELAFITGGAHDLVDATQCGLGIIRYQGGAITAGVQNFSVGVPFRKLPGAEGWIYYSSGKPRLLTGDLIVIDKTLDNIHQLEIKNNAPECMVPKMGGTHLRIIATAKGVEIGGSGFRVRRHGRVESSTLRDQDVVEVPGERVVLRYVEGEGILGGVRVVNGKAERFYPRHTGLLPIVGSSELKNGIEGIFDVILTGANGAARDVALTIDDDLQRLAQLEYETTISMARIDKRTENFGTGKFEGALVLLNSSTGEILASASYPVTDYDKTMINDAIGFDLVNGSMSSMVNRGWKLLKFHPGSTFKIVTATAAFSVAGVPGATTPNYAPPIARMLDGSCPSGYRDESLEHASVPSSLDASASIAVNGRVHNAHNGKFDCAPVETALAKSSNTYFGYLTILMYNPLRSGSYNSVYATEEAYREKFPLLYFAEKFGYNRQVDLLPASFAPLDNLLKRRSNDVLYTEKSSFPYDIYDYPSGSEIGAGRIAMSGIGQGEVEATPLQQAIVVATVANEGNLVVPYLVKRAAGLEAGPVPPPQRVISTGLGRIREGMRRVVSGEGGTAAETFATSPLRNYLLAKTGTAQRGKKREDSFFVGYVAPARNMSGSRGRADATSHPIAFACLIAEAGPGARHAGATMERLLRRMQRYYDWEGN